MKKIKSIKIPKCPKCKKLMEVGFTTELQEGSKKKPEVIICFGTCKKCKVRLVFDLIKTKDLPSSIKELEEIAQKRRSESRK